MSDESTDQAEDGTGGYDAGARRVFETGQVLFREGEASRDAYEVVSGTITLTRQAGGGTLTLGSAGPGDIVGEVGALDGQPRTATATAAGRATVRVLPRDTFLQRLQDDSRLNHKVMARLAERLRQADAALAQQGAPASPPAAGGNGGWRLLAQGLMQWLRRLGAPRARAPARPAGVVHWTVLMGPVAGDSDDAAGTEVRGALAALDGVRVQPVTEPVLDPEEPAATTRVRLRQAFAEHDADLLVAGVLAEGGSVVRLYMVSAASPDRPGQPHPDVPVPAALPLDEPGRALVSAAVLAALEPRPDMDTRPLHEGLTAALNHARAAAQGERLTGLSMADQAGVLAAFGNVAAGIGALEGTATWFPRAASAYNKALERLPRHAEVPWARIQRMRAVCLQTEGEHETDGRALAEAAEALRLAAEVFTRELVPGEWSRLQMRLGAVLARHEQQTSDTESLKGAITAYQNALNSTSRQDEPWRWAEIMNALCQVLTVYGDQWRSAEALDRAIQAGEAALEVRTEAAAPVLWATTQNNLGSAHFLRARHGRTPSNYEKAANAFHRAHAVFEAHHMKRMKQVAHTNLDRASAAFESATGRKVAQTAWEEGTEEAET